MNARLKMFNPGSYTKNFGWSQYGHGLYGLYQAIQNGIEGSSEQVARNHFRSRCGVDDDSRQLIPVNFFLHNSVVGGVNHVSFDELVRHALLNPHSRQFDRLALFAFHLAHMGRRRGVAGESYGAAFANMFVRCSLWQEGGWRSSSLTPDNVEDVFSRTIKAQGSDTVHKCVTNYLFTLEVCGLRQQKTEFVNTSADEWIGPALFLAFDRFSLDDGGTLASERLHKIVEEEELYKLIGVPPQVVNDTVGFYIDKYLSLGGLNRQSGIEARHGVSEAFSVPPPTSYVVSGTTEPSPPVWSDEDAEDIALVMRRLRQFDAQVRNSRNIRELKALYNHICAFCGRKTVVSVAPFKYYSEAAHVKPVGAPHYGSDRKDNMLVLCPEHHLQFDRGIVGMGRDSSGCYIVSKISGDPVSGRRVKLLTPHTLDPDNVDWHFFYWRFDRTDQEREVTPF